MKHEHTSLLATWIGTFVVFIFLFTIVAPGRGASWISDDGLFLAHAWNVAEGFGFDGMLPQQPNYLINAFIIKLGITEILYHRYIFYLLWIIAASIFFSSLDSYKISCIRLIAISATLCVAFSSILVGWAFFPIALGCYFFSTRADASYKYKPTLLILSGIFFAAAAFMHIAYVIAVSLTIACIYWLDSSVRRSALAPIFLAGSMFFWGIYLHELGIDRFLTAPAGHETDPMHILGNALRVLWFFVSAVLIFYLFALLFRRKGSQRFIWAQYSLSLLVTAIYFAKFFSAHLISIFPEQFVSLFFNRYTSEKLMNAQKLVVDVPGGIYYLLIFVICRWWVDSFGDDFNFSLRHPMYSLRSFSQFLRADSRRMCFFIASVGLCLLPAGYAAGSASSFPICLAAFSGPVLGLTLMLWKFIDRDHLAFIPRAILVAWCCIFIVFSVRMNLPTFEPILAKDSEILLVDSPIRGIRETARYADAVEQLKVAYQSGNCKAKVFLLLDYVPLVHLILQHEVPNSFGVVRPGVYFPESKIMQSLDEAAGWCILDATMDETKVMMRSRDVRENVRARAKKEARQSYNLPSPSIDVEPMVLYVN